MRILQARARAAHRRRNRPNGLRLADDTLAELLLHAQKLFLLALEHPVDRHPGPARHHLRHVIRGHRFLDHGALAFRRLDALELLLDLRNAAIGELTRALVFTFALRIGELDAQVIELGLELLRVRKLVLLGFPACRQIGGLLFERHQFLLEPLEPLLRAWIALFLECFLLDLEPHDLAVDRIEFLGLGIDLHLEPRSSLVDQIDRLVRKKAVGDVAVRQRRRRHDRRIGDADTVVLLVSVLQAAQDRNRIFDRGLADKDRLEATGERCVLFDVLLVLVEGGCTDTMKLAPCKRRLEQVRRVHGAVSLAGPDQRVHLVDEQDDAAVRRRHLLQHGLEPLFELAAIFRAGDQGTHVERKQLLVVQALRHVAVDDALGETLDDGGLADTGFADQHRVVLRAAGEHLDGAPDFLVAPDHGVDLAVARGLGEIARVFFQRVIGVFGGACVGRAALAQRVDGLVEVLRRDAGARQNLSGLAVFLERERQQQALDGDVAVAGLFRDLLGLIEYPRERRCQIDLASAAARDLRQLGESGLDRRERLARPAAGAVNQATGQPFGVVQQNLEQMLGCELLLALAQRERLGRLNEPAGAVREFLEIHNVSLGLPLRPCGTKVHPNKPINRERSMAPTPNGGRQILCGNSRFAAEEPVADFRARPRQAAAWRLTSLA